MTRHGSSIAPGHHLDAVVLGTSPLMLVKALSLQRQGLSVAAIDRRPEPGGSWYTTSMLGFANVEPGVHLIENRPDVYRYLEERLGIALHQGSDVEDLGIVFGRPLAIGPTRVALHLLVGSKALVAGDTDKARRTYLSAVRALRWVREPTRYPIGGCAAITSVLLEQLREGGACVETGIAVDRIVVDDDLSGVTLETAAGSVRANSVVLGSRAHAPLEYCGRPETLEQTLSTSWSLVLCLQAERARPFDYVELIGDPLIRRLRDVGRFTHSRPAEDQHLVCVQLRPSPRSTGQPIHALAQRVASHLVDHGLFTHGASVLRYQLDEYALPTVHDREMDRLQGRFAPAVQALKTTDLADELSTLLGTF